MSPERVIIGNAELPPYGISYVHGGGGKGRWGRVNHSVPIHGDDQPFDPTPLLRFPVVLMFGADHYRRRLPDGGTLIAWDKSVGKGPKDSFADAEFIWTNLKIKRNVIRYLWKGIACEKAGEENGRRWHPTTKPQGVMRWCLEQIPQAGVILDPYMGSGSTGCAAVALGRTFIGIEIDRRYFDIACERIARAQAQTQPGLADPAPQQAAL